MTIKITWTDVSVIDSKNQQKYGIGKDVDIKVLLYNDESSSTSLEYQLPELFGLTEKTHIYIHINENDPAHDDNARLIIGDLHQKVLREKITTIEGTVFVGEDFGPGSKSSREYHFIFKIQVSEN